MLILSLPWLPKTHTSSTEIWRSKAKNRLQGPFECVSHYRGPRGAVSERSASAMGGREGSTLALLAPLMRNFLNLLYPLLAYLSYHKNLRKNSPTLAPSHCQPPAPRATQVTPLLQCCNGSHLSIPKCPQIWPHSSTKETKQCYQIPARYICLRKA